jgi:hypothetical protein
VDEGEVRVVSSWDTSVASRQKIAIITLEGVKSVGLQDGGPKRPRLAVGGMNKGGVSVNSSSDPASVAPGKIFSVSSLEGDLGSDNFEGPGRGRSGEGGGVGISSGSAVGADADILAVVSEEVD